MKWENFYEKTKNILASIGKLLFVLVLIALFAIITVLTGELVNYSPWSLVVIDLVFVFAVYKFVSEFYHNESCGINEKKSRFWHNFFLILITLAVILSIAISLEHSWAIINLVFLVFLFFLCLVLFSKNVTRKRVQVEFIQ